jgi:transposase
MENKTPTQTKFILLRSDGLSFDKIAKELKVSKVTLIQWSKLFEDDIKELQFLQMVEIKKQYSNTVAKRYETLLQQLDKIDNAILEADLLETPLKDLIQLQQHTYSQIESIEKRFKTKAYITNKNEFGMVENLELTLNEA